MTELKPISDDEFILALHHIEGDAELLGNLLNMKLAWDMYSSRGATIDEMYTITPRILNICVDEGILKGE